MDLSNNLNETEFELNLLKRRRVELELENSRLKQIIKDQENRIESLSELESRFKKLADESSDLSFIFCLDPAPHFIYINSSSRILESEPEDFFAHPLLLFELIHPEDLEILKQSLSRQQRTSQQVDLRWLLPSGKIVWTDCRFRPIFNQINEAVSHVAILRDITWRKNAEQAMEKLVSRLEIERRWLETIFEFSPIGKVIVRLLPDGREVAQFNQSGRAIFGKDIQLEKGRAAFWGRLFRSDFSVAAPETLPSSRALRGEFVAPEEYWLRQSDRPDVPLLISASPIFNDKHQIEGAVVAFQNITPIKELERLKEEWTSIVAHDLRQPVTIIKLHADLLMETPGMPDIVHKTGQRLHNSADYLNRLIGDLLDASRIEAKNLSLDKKAINLETFTRDLVERLKPQLADRPIELYLEGAFAPLSFDPIRIEQVLINLMTNAAKYGFPKTPIRLKVENLDNRVQFSVTNSGKGIPKEELPNLFARFQRVSWAKKQGIKGIGLGLYITKGLIEAHGGHIGVESVLNQETTFYFQLPKDRQPQD